jgi:hypothetical protein
MLPRIRERLRSRLNAVVATETGNKRLLQPWLDTNHKGIERLNAHLDSDITILARQDVPPPVSLIQAAEATK